MKQICATILLLVYLYCTVGAIIQQHYCMGELVSSSLFGSGDKECGKCGMKKHIGAANDCCKDVSIVIKAGDSHTFSPAVYDFPAFSFILTVLHFIAPGFKITTSQTANLYGAHGPPLLKHSLFIHFRNFRI